MSKLVLLIGLALLGLSLICFTILSPLLHVPEIFSKIIPLTQPIVVCGSCDIVGQKYIGEGSVSDLMVQGELPEQMNLDTSDTIALELTGPRQVYPSQIPSPTPTPINRKIVIPDISHSLDDDLAKYCLDNNIIGSDCTINILFGPGYEVFASAYLITTSFDVQLLGPGEQSANQTKIEWAWNIFPKSVGSQIINIGILLHWKPLGNNGKEDILRQILQTSTTIVVNPPPFIQPGQITISGAVSGLFGLIFTGFSLTWIYEERKKRQELKKTTNETKGTTRDDNNKHTNGL